MAAVVEESRAWWMKILAQADREQLQRLWQNLPVPPAHSFIRPPECGLIMVRGQACGCGALFNLGEITVTRCTVRLEQGLVGHATVIGRDLEHARLAAMFDALLQDPRRRERLIETVCRPLARLQQRRQRRTRAKTATTRVNFFTMVRGEG